MKVSPSVKRICENCRVIRRHGRVMVICVTRAISSVRAESRSSGINSTGAESQPVKAG